MNESSLDIQYAEYVQHSCAPEDTNCMWIWASVPQQSIHDVTHVRHWGHCHCLHEKAIIRGNRVLPNFTAQWPVVYSDLKIANLLFCITVIAGHKSQDTDSKPRRGAETFPSRKNAFASLFYGFKPFQIFIPLIFGIVQRFFIKFYYKLCNWVNYNRFNT